MGVGRKIGAISKKLRTTMIVVEIVAAWTNLRKTHPLVLEGARPSGCTDIKES